MEHVAGMNEYLQEQFEIFQQDDSAVSVSAASRASNIKKHLSILALNNSVSKLSLQETKTDQTDKLSDQLTAVLLQFVDRSVATEISNENRDCVDRVMELAAALAVACGEAVVEAVAVRAMEFSSVLLERVRAQACQLIGWLALSLTGSRQSNKNEWATEWLEAFKEDITPRLTDKSQAVRQAAIKACGNFFVDESTIDENILESLLWNTWHDPSVANRAVAIASLPISEETIDHIISRIRDVKEKVRIQALEVLLEKVDPASQMNQEHFADIVRFGLCARCETTKATTVKLVCSKWMKAAKFNPVSLLNMMSVTDNEEECEKLTVVIIETALSHNRDATNELSDPEIRAFRESIEANVVQLSDTTKAFDPAALFFSRIACSTVQSLDSMTVTDKENLINKVVPDVPMLCEIVQRHALRLSESIQQEDTENEDLESFVCLELLHIAKIAGVNEEGSRRHFSTVVKGMLSSAETPDELVEGCVKAMQTTCQDENEFVDTVSQIVAELMSAETESKDELEKLLHLRVLSIITIFLENASTASASHPMLQDLATIVAGAVTNSDALVREAGVSCLGKLGLFMDEETVLREYKPLLLKISSRDDEKIEIRSQALIAMSDWALLFSEILQPCEAGGSTLSFLSVLQEMVQHTNSSVSAIAAEAAAKLLFAGKICESSLIAHLLILFFNPNQHSGEVSGADVKEVGNPVRLQQVLSLFFPAYAFNSEHGRDAMLGSIESALSLALKVSETKSKGRKAAFPLIKMVEYICCVVETGRETASSSAEASVPATPKSIEEGSQNQPVSSSIALIASIQVAQFLVKDNGLTVNQLRGLSKFIASQVVDEQLEERKHLREMKGLVEELGMMITDDSALRSLETFSRQVLSDVDDTDDEECDEDDNSGASELSNGGALCEDEESTKGENASTGETTVEDSLMESIAGLTVTDKENTVTSSAKRRTSARRSSPRGNTSALTTRNSLGDS